GQCRRGEGEQRQKHFLVHGLTPANCSRSGRRPPPRARGKGPPRMSSRPATCSKTCRPPRSSGASDLRGERLLLLLLLLLPKKGLGGGASGTRDQDSSFFFFFALAWSSLLAFSSSSFRPGGRFFPARLMKYWIMRIPEPMPLGLTSLLAITLAMVRASL